MPERRSCQIETDLEGVNLSFVFLHENVYGSKVRFMDRKRYVDQSPPQRRCVAAGFGARARLDHNKSPVT